MFPSGGRVRPRESLQKIYHKILKKKNKTERNFFFGLTDKTQYIYRQGKSCTQLNQSYHPCNPSISLYATHYKHIKTLYAKHYIRKHYRH